MSNPPSSSCHISTDMTSFDIIFSKASCTQKTGERCQREMGVHRAESERETTHLLGNSAAGAEQQAAARSEGRGDQHKAVLALTLLPPRCWSWRPGPGCEEEILVIGDSSTMTAAQ